MKHEDLSVPIPATPADPVLAERLGALARASVPGVATAVRPRRVVGVVAAGALIAVTGAGAATAAYLGHDRHHPHPVLPAAPTPSTAPTTAPSAADHRDQTRTPGSDAALPSHRARPTDDHGSDADGQDSGDRRDRSDDVQDQPGDSGDSGDQHSGDQQSGDGRPDASGSDQVPREDSADGPEQGGSDGQ